MDYFWYAYIIILGSIIGSFLNVCILRLPEKQSVITGRSHCPGCNTPLKPRHMIPVISFLFLRGRCPFCKNRISRQYPLVESLTALLFFLTIWVHGYTIYSLLLCIFHCILIVVSGIDFHTMTIPDILTLYLLLLGIVRLILFPAFLSQALIGFVILSLPMLLAALLTSGFGGGDIKLCAACGLFLGWSQALIGFLLACILASLYGIWFIWVKKASLKTAIPFGPFLSMGFLLAALYGSQLTAWYQGLLF